MCVSDEGTDAAEDVARLVVVIIGIVGAVWDVEVDAATTTLELVWSIVVRVALAVSHKAATR